MSRSHRPETYLQFAGKAILEQFSRKLHGLLALPESVPYYVLELLCLDPFQRVLTQVSHRLRPLYGCLLVIYRLLSVS